MNRDFKGIWIPREIWLKNQLSVQEKCLWAEIDSLHDKEKGGCFASNEYLMEFIGVKERRLQEMLANLKKHGFLIQVEFNGRQRILNAVIPSPCTSEVQKSAPLGCRKVHPSGAEKCAPSYIEIKEENKEEKEVYAPISKRLIIEDKSTHAPPNGDAKENSSASQSQERKIQKAPNVFVTDSEHQKLVAKHGESLTQEGYEDLSEWKKSATPSQVKKHTSDYYRLRKWVLPAILEGNAKADKLQQGKIATHRKGSKLTTAGDLDEDTFKRRRI